MEKQVPISHDAVAPDITTDGLHVLTNTVAYRRLAIVNIAMIGPENAGDRGWFLVDTGMIGSAPMIRSAANARFGDGARPRAILMTHGHFDHVGALETLSKAWDAPIYAHRLELPFLSGQEAYPPPDPTVGGGLMARLSPLFPRGPIDVRDHLHELPDDHTIPGLPGWEWIATPGHSPGHVSFWEPWTRTLIVGDAFITTRQESVYAVATQREEIHGPPMYFTPDWTAAEQSVKTLAALDPDIVITGHGRAMRGEEMRRALHTLANHFDVARPAK